MSINTLHKGDDDDDNNNNNIQPLLLSSLTGFSLRVFSSFRPVAAQIFVSLCYSFVLVPGWWIPYTYRFFLPLCGTQNFLRFVRNVRFLCVEKTEELSFRTEFCGTPGRSCWKPMRPGRSQGNRATTTVISKECVSFHFQGGKRKMFPCRLMGKGCHDDTTTMMVVVMMTMMMVMSGLATL